MRFTYDLSSKNIISLCEHNFENRITYAVAKVKQRKRAEQTIYTQHYAIENRIVFSFRQIRFYNFLYALLKREKCVRKKRDESAIYIVPQSTIKSLTLYGKAKFHWLHARCGGQVGRRAGEEENWVWIACYAGVCRVRQEATRPLSGCHKFT